MQRALSVWGQCQAFDPAAIDDVRAAAGSLLVVDIDLADRETVVHVRSGLEPHRRAGANCLFLLRDMSARCQTQANALGAKQVLPADTPLPILLDSVGTLLGKMPEGGGASAAIPRNFIAASAAFSGVMDAVAAGRAIPLQAIDDSVEALNRGADSADLNSWLDLVWQHDDATYQHCLLVSGLVAAFAQRLGFREHDRQLITRAAVLHDVGKARIPLDILRKQGPLDEGERMVMRRHPALGHDLLVAQGGFPPLLLAGVLSHHEMLDGSGYPNGIGAGQLPDLVRMITVCDIYGALIENRPYKAPMAPEEAFTILLGMGDKLDIDLVRVFGDVVLDAAAGRLRAKIPGSQQVPAIRVA